jgi:hypothetical protein
MSKYFEILVDGKMIKSFNGSKEPEATTFFHETKNQNLGSTVKLVLHRRKGLLVYK